MFNIQILTLMPKKIKFLFRKKFKHASRAKNSSCYMFVWFFSQMFPYSHVKGIALCVIER